MSYLMFDQDIDRVVIVTDTLSTDANDRPHMFQRKVWTIPHMNLVFTVTGTANVGDIFHHVLTNSLTPHDIEGLNEYAPDALRAIHSNLSREHGDIGTSTVYVFGFPSDSEELVRYTYRSARDYEPERFVGSVAAIKPPPHAFTAEYTESPEGYVELAERVRDENDSGVSPEPVKIGGDLFVTTFQNWDVRTRRLHRFYDYAEHYKQMTAKENG